MRALENFSKSEISLHTNKKDCWVVIHGKVYDVTTFLDDHPGGDEVLLHASASGDATQSFEDIGHSSTAISMMEGYFIGTVEGHTDSSDSAGADMGPAATAAAAAAARNKALLEKKQPPSSSFTELALPIFILLVAFGAWYYLTFIDGKAQG